MNLLEKTNEINKYNSTIQLSEVKEGHLYLCQVECTNKNGKQKWKHLFPSVYSDCAMLRTMYLLDLPFRFFIVYQVNEHSRGGHTIDEMKLMDLKGQVLHYFTSSDSIKFMLEDTKLWILKKTGVKHVNYTEDIEVELLTIDMVSGKIDQQTKLDFNRFIAPPYDRVYFIEFASKKQQNMLRIVYTDDYNEKKTEHVLLSSSIFT